MERNYNNYQVHKKLEGLLRDPVLGEIHQNITIGRSRQLQAEGRYKRHAISEHKTGNTLYNKLSLLLSTSRSGHRSSVAHEMSPGHCRSTSCTLTTAIVLHTHMERHGCTGWVATAAAERDDIHMTSKMPVGASKGIKNLCQCLLVAPRPQHDLGPHPAPRQPLTPRLSPNDLPQGYAPPSAGLT